MSGAKRDTWAALSTASATARYTCAHAASSPGQPHFLLLSVSSLQPCEILRRNKIRTIPTVHATLVQRRASSLDNRYVHAPRRLRHT